jgi:hypothetical protein
MNPRGGLLHALRSVRVSRSQLALVSAISTAATILIIVSALGHTRVETAVIAALHRQQVFRARAPAVSTTTTAASAPSAPAGTGEAGAGAAASEDPAPSDPAVANTNAVPAADGSNATTSATSTSASTSTKPPSKVKHLFVIVLSDSGYRSAFGPSSAAHYLNSKLRPKAELLSQYHTLGGSGLPDSLAMVSGQAPNRDTTADCSTYGDFPGAAAPGKSGQVPGAGCVYPDTTLTIGDQLDGANLPWRSYVDAMTQPCQHPNSGALDSVAAGDYATHQNPFVYFHSLLDLGDCQSDDLSLTKLDRALGTTSQTPSYTFIAPDPCDAGLVDPCPDGKPGGLAAADAFLQHVVPTILKSPAYRASGALVIAFTAGGAASGTAASSTTTVPSTTTTAPSSSATVPSTTTTAPSSSTTVPSTTTTASTTVSSPTTPSTEPIRTGALILSRYTRAGSTDPKAYNPYSVLRSAEDVFGLSPLGRAKGAASFAGTAFAAG